MVLLLINTHLTVPNTFRIKKHVCIMYMVDITSKIAFRLKNIPIRYYVTFFLQVTISNLLATASDTKNFITLANMV